MLHVIIYGAIGVAVVAVLVAVFIRTGEKEAAANPRRAEALLVERSGDPALINLYYKARSDEERAEIAGFARAAQPDPEEPEEPEDEEEEEARAEAEAIADAGAFTDFPEDAEAAAEKKPGLLERHRARQEARAVAKAAAAAEAAKVTVRLADQAGEKYDDLESAMAAAISKLEGPPAPSAEAVPAEPLPETDQPLDAKPEAAAPEPAREAESLPAETEVDFAEPRYMLYNPAPETGFAPLAREEAAAGDEGQALSRAVEENLLCTYCGAELERGCKFCIICGMPAQDIEVRPAARPEPAPEPKPEQSMPLALDPFADRSAYIAAKVLPQEPAAAAPAAEAPAAEAPDSAEDGSEDGAGEKDAGAELPPVYSLEEILRNVRQLEKRINREEDGGIGYHDAE